MKQTTISSSPIIYIKREREREEEEEEEEKEKTPILTIILVQVMEGYGLLIGLGLLDELNTWTKILYY